MSSSLRYLLVLTVCALALFGGAWVVAAKGKIGFLPTQYVIYDVKRDMLDRCDVGEVMVVGDSRPMVGIIPAQMPVPTRNLALGAASPIEGYYAIEKALACPQKPKLVVLSLSLREFASPANFWRFSAAYGYLDEAEMLDVRRFAKQVRSEKLFKDERGDGLPDGLRIWLYARSFPSFYLGSMLEGLVVSRRAKNLRAKDQLIRDHGQFYYGREPYSHNLNDDTEVKRFTVSPLVEAYLDRLVARLEKDGTPLVFTAVPMNDASFAALKPGVAEGFRAYMAAYQKKHPSFQVMGDVVPHWTDDHFGDQQHLNPKGAKRFTAEFAGRLAEAGQLPAGRAP